MATADRAAGGTAAEDPSDAYAMAEREYRARVPGGRLAILLVREGADCSINDVPLGICEALVQHYGLQQALALLADSERLEEQRQKLRARLLDREWAD